MSGGPTIVCRFIGLLELLDLLATFENLPHRILSPSSSLLRACIFTQVPWTAIGSE